MAAAVRFETKLRCWIIQVACEIKRSAFRKLGSANIRAQLGLAISPTANNYGVGYTNRHSNSYNYFHLSCMLFSTVEQLSQYMFSVTYVDSGTHI
jgi:hypothetical protein